MRLPVALARELKAQASSARTSPSAVLRRAAAEYVRKGKAGRKLNAMQEHLLSRAGAWDGDVSGAESLRRTRP